MARILWFSNSPWAASGYGNQTKLFCMGRLQTLGHKVAISAFYGLDGGVLDAGDVKIYPRGMNVPAPCGIDSSILPFHARDFNADLVMSLMDVWVIPPGITQPYPFCPWFPIDMEPLPPPIARSLEGTLMPLVFSHFGERMMSAAGLPYRYVPHGVDTAVFAPKPRTEARDAMNLPQDRFIVGMVAANKGSPSRKAFKQQIEAFARLHRKHPDTMLYLHTAMLAGDGENLHEFCEQMGLTDGSVIYSEQQQYALGYPESFLQDLYCSFDVLTNVSMGEGFGITILEAQACGTPVIVGDWTSMSELCFSGWKVPQERAEKWHTLAGAYQWWPSVEGIFEQMEASYLADDRKERGAVARRVAETYDADVVTETFWGPVLSEIEQMIADRRPRRFEEYVSVAS